ncbi:SDR family NAD(P)-dependent oxidoreductase [Actinoplanes sp. NPDC023714]|uniref:SDR family NAD(P)-dependent oxidoreductase n=1 Tax=Actinoplanes sp. NPDC023714 TaxID=3154322 RepID=UPI0033C1FA58
MAGTVAVTGADGFIGSHLTEGLVANGYRVRAMVRHNAFDSEGWLDTLPPDVLAEVEILAGDVEDPAGVARLVRGAHTVYHLAALTAISYSYLAPRSYLNTNVLGTLNVLEAVRAERCERLIHTSSSEIYGTAQGVPITESHPVQAPSPYAASKVAADKLVESYHLSFGVPAVTLRPFNTFGPRQPARALIPSVIAQLLAGASEIRLGATAPTRDFTFVADIVAAFLAVGAAPATTVIGETFNAGSGQEISIGDLAARAGELAGRRVPVLLESRRVHPPRSQARRLVCDSTRLRDHTGWRPRYSLDDGLKTTVAWFLDPDNLARYHLARSPR